MSAMDPNGHIELVYDDDPPPPWAAPSVGDLINVTDGDAQTVSLIVTAVVPIPSGYSVRYMLDPSS